jgi:hypothetical protein
LGQKPVLGYKLLQRCFAFVPVDIEDNDSRNRAGSDTDVRGRPYGPPFLYLFWIGAGVFAASHRARMFTGRVTTRAPATATTADNGVMQRQHMPTKRGVMQSCLMELIHRDALHHSVLLKWPIAAPTWFTSAIV